MKKTVYTLSVDNYAPEITALTFPLLRNYAQKIGAEFHVITERKFPGWPPAVEKLQIHQLGREAGNDWNIYIDADALVHPDTPDLTEHLKKDTVMHHATDMAGVRWSYDEYFRRDGRHVGSGNWLAIASDWCLDLWTPPDMSPARAVAAIHPILAEVASGVDRLHLIDDYLLSRNIARFGLKVDTALALFGRLGLSPYFFWHQYTIPTSAKAAAIGEVLQKWNLAP